MAVILEGGCHVSDMREGEPFISGTLRIWNQIGQPTGAEAISLRVMEFGPGLSPHIRNGDCDEILYVLGNPNEPDAQNNCVSILINGIEHFIGSDTGVYIRPHQTVALNNTGTASVWIISSQCPDPASPSEFAEVLSVPPGPADAHKSPFVRLADRPAQLTADRWYRVLIDHEVGSTRATQFVGSIPPGRAPDHFHTYEEVLFILKGEGRMWAGQTNTAIGTGSCIFLPKRQVHCVENTGTGELRLLGVFYPAGSPSVRYDMD